MTAIAGSAGWHLSDCLTKAAIVSLKATLLVVFMQTDECVFIDVLCVCVCVSLGVSSFMLM